MPRIPGYAETPVLSSERGDPVLYPYPFKLYADALSCEKRDKFLGTDYVAGECHDQINCVSILDDILDRTWRPLAARCTKDNFLTPYGSGPSFFAGLVSGPGLALCTAYWSVDFILIPAGIELVVAFGSLAQALYYTVKGNEQKGLAYARDGLTRLCLAPALLLACAVSIPFELVRFVVRLTMTAIHVLKQLWNAVFPSDGRKQLVQVSGLNNIPPAVGLGMGASISPL